MLRNIACGFVFLLLAFATVGDSARAITLTYSLADTSLNIPGGHLVPGPLDGSARVAALSEVTSCLVTTILEPGAITRHFPVYIGAHALTNGGQLFTTFAPAAVGVGYGDTQSGTPKDTLAPVPGEVFGFNHAGTPYFDADPATIDVLKTSPYGTYGPFAEIDSLDDKLLIDSLLIDSIDTIVIQPNDATHSLALPIGRELTYLSDAFPSALNPTLATDAVAREWTRLDLAVLVGSGRETSPASSARSLIVMLLFTPLAVILVALSFANQQAPIRLSPFVMVRLTISSAICREGSLLLLSLECPRHLLRNGIRLKLASALRATARMPHANPRFVAFDFVIADYRLIIPICQSRAAH